MNPHKQDQPVMEHVDELRSRLVKTAIVFVMALFAGFFVAEPIIKYIQYSDEAAQFTMNAFKVTDPLSVYLTVTFIVGLLLTSPMLLYQLWAFITPGLYEAERRATLKYIPYAFILFIAGILFAYYVLFPFVMKFMNSLANDLDITQTIGINEYFTFLFKLVIPFGLIFQLPVVTLFLSRIGVLNPIYMVKFRKYSYFVLFVIAVLLAPPDVVSYIVISIPLFILYEFSLVIAKIGHKKYVVAEEKRVREQEERDRELQVEELLAEQRRQIELMKQQ